MRARWKQSVVAVQTAVCNKEVETRTICVELPSVNANGSVRIDFRRGTGQMHRTEGHFCIHFNLVVTKAY
jgi:hypothetical protein